MRERTFLGIVDPANQPLSLSLHPSTTPLDAWVRWFGRCLPADKLTSRIRHYESLGYRVAKFRLKEIPDD